jgi:hypothetical protein
MKIALLVLALAQQERQIPEERPPAKGRDWVEHSWKQGQCRCRYCGSPPWTTWNPGTPWDEPEPQDYGCGPDFKAAFYTDLKPFPRGVSFGPDLQLEDPITFDPITVTIQNPSGPLGSFEIDGLDLRTQNGMRFALDLTLAELTFSYWLGDAEPTEFLAQIPNPNPGLPPTLSEQEIEWHMTSIQIGLMRPIVELCWMHFFASVSVGGGFSRITADPVVTPFTVPTAPPITEPNPLFGIPPAPDQGVPDIERQTFYGGYASMRVVVAWQFV